MVSCDCFFLFGFNYEILLESEGIKTTIRGKVLVGHQIKKRPKGCENIYWQVYIYIFSYSDSRPQTMLYVRLPVRWFIFCMLLETCRVFFSVIDLLDGWRRGEVLGQCTFFKFCLYSKWFDL